MAFGDATSGWRRANLLVTMGAAILGTATMLVQCSGEPQGARPRATTSRHQLSVAPFRADSSPRERLAQVLAESLASRLSALPGLAARAESGRSSAEFLVRGELARQDGRLVIAARLYGDRDDSALWSATYWRKDSLTTDLIGDVAVGLAEGIYGYLARGSATTTRGKP